MTFENVVITTICGRGSFSNTAKQAAQARVRSLFVGLIGLAIGSHLHVVEGGSFRL